MMVAAPYTFRYARLDQLQPLTMSAPIDCWLSTAECAVYDRWRDSRRRAAWLGGRWLAKHLILQELMTKSNRSLSYPQIEIYSGQAEGRRERPQITIAQRRLPRSLSITHTARGVLAALATAPGIRLGVDLVEAANHGVGFVRCWFTEAEQRWLQQGHDKTGQVAAAWAVKEALYKACNEGEGFSPRTIQVQPASVGTFSCVYAGIPLGAACRVRSWQIDGQRAALAYVRRPARSGVLLAGALQKLPPTISSP